MDRRRFTIASKRVHPEDIEVGDYLAPFDVERSPHPFKAIFMESWMDEPDRWTGPAVKQDVPLKVVGVCLPYLHCEKWDGSTMVYDVRQISFYRLDRKFAKRLIKSLQEDGKRRLARRRLLRRGEDDDGDRPGPPE